MSILNFTCLINIACIIADISLRGTLLLCEARRRRIRYEAQVGVLDSFSPRAGAPESRGFHSDCIRCDALSKLNLRIGRRSTADPRSNASRSPRGDGRSWPESTARAASRRRSTRSVSRYWPQAPKVTYDQKGFVQFTLNQYKGRSETFPASCPAKPWRRRKDEAEWEIGNRKLEITPGGGLPVLGCPAVHDGWRPRTERKTCPAD